MLDFINTFLAGLVDKFKQKSPVAYGIVMLVLLAVQVVLNNLVGFFPEVPEGTLTEILKWVDMVLLGLTGSRTYNFLPENKEEVKNS